MRRLALQDHQGRGVCVLCGLLLLAVAGCFEAGTPAGPEGGATPSVGATEAGANNTAASARPLEPLPFEVAVLPAPSEIPAVHMTETALRTCLVGVGDVMPAGVVQDLSGRMLPLRSAYGRKATVVVLWSAGADFEVERAKGLLSDLQLDVVRTFSELGVGVVAVNPNDSPDTVRGLMGQAGATYPAMLDPQGALYRQLATEHLPRIYVLDAQGAILWFDIEYSETTRDELLETLRYVTAGARP